MVLGEHEARGRAILAKGLDTGNPPSLGLGSG